jgi:hypothetical protein
MNAARNTALITAAAAFARCVGHGHYSAAFAMQMVREEAKMLNDDTGLDGKADIASCVAHVCF